MNCKQCQEGILESLAGGADRRAREVSDHEQTCEVCREFREAQASLFRSMDAGVQFLANQSMPPSLLPGVRARLEHTAVLHRGRVPNWSFAIVAAVAILAVSVGYALRPPSRHPSSPSNGSVVSQYRGAPAATVQKPWNSEPVSPHREHKRSSTVARTPASSPSVPQVIVLAEERNAFVKFVAELPEKKEVALALTRAAEAPEDVPIEIALLQIESLELKPLEGTPRE